MTHVSHYLNARDILWVSSFSFCHLNFYMQLESLCFSHGQFYIVCAQQLAVQEICNTLIQEIYFMKLLWCNSFSVCSIFHFKIQLDFFFFLISVIALMINGNQFIYSWILLHLLYKFIHFYVGFSFDSRV